MAVLMGISTFPSYYLLGWSRGCMQEWGPFLHLAIPSMLMHCLECWLYEIAGFLAGVIREVELGAHSMVYQLAAIAFMFPMGFCVAATVRVGNALGAGNTEQAKMSSKVCLICADPATLACIIGACLGVSRDVVGYIFTTEKAVDGVFNLRFQSVHIFFLVFLCKLNWKKATKEALVRAGVHVMERHKIFGIENKALDTGEKQANIRTNRSSSLSPAEGKLEALGAGQQTSDDVALSVRQLVVRRGLAVLLMFIILTAGVFISELLIRLLELDE